MHGNPVKHRQRHLLDEEKYSERRYNHEQMSTVKWIMRWPNVSDANSANICCTKMLHPILELPAQGHCGQRCATNALQSFRLSKSPSSDPRRAWDSSSEKFGNEEICAVESSLAIQYLCLNECLTMYHDK